MSLTHADKQWLCELARYVILAINKCAVSTYKSQMASILAADIRKFPNGTQDFFRSQT